MILRFAQHAVYGDTCSSYETHKQLLNVDNVRIVTCNSLKKGKANSAENITGKNIFYCDSIITFHLCNLFNLIIQHDYVPAQFGSGIIIPLIKDRMGDAIKQTITVQLPSVVLFLKYLISVSV